MRLLVIFFSLLHSWHAQIVFSLCSNVVLCGLKFWVRLSVSICILESAVTSAGKWSCPNYKCKFSIHVRQTHFLWKDFNVWLWQNQAKLIFQFSVCPNITGAYCKPCEVERRNQKGAEIWDTPSLRGFLTEHLAPTFSGSIEDLFVVKY